jgi:hypothetical protein
MQGFSDPVAFAFFAPDCCLDQLVLLLFTKFVQCIAVLVFFLLIKNDRQQYAHNEEEHYCYAYDDYKSQAFTRIL